MIVIGFGARAGGGGAGGVTIVCLEPVDTAFTPDEITLLKDNLLA